ncbi:retroviral-like aspartic protease family protein [Bacteroides sp. OttesenSCG-928-E20]|nr:retroviral-like aspartic protease family protein [Bacteroides sp. OttesenSCG-928-E20]
MKLKNLLSICLILTFCGGLRAQNIDEELTYWINSGDYLQLKRRYQEEKTNIQSKTVKLMAEAFICTAFNKPADALKALNELITQHQEALGINGITTCVNLMAENLRYQGKYFTAADILTSYIKQTDTFNGLDEAIRTNLLSQCALAAFGDEMKPEIIRPVETCEVPIVDNPGAPDHALYIHVELNGNTVHFLFDTGCEGYATNMVTEKFARDNGIRILNDSVTVHGINAETVRMGIAEKMTIGSITYRNVAFMVSPGNNLLSTDTLQLDAVLGTTFMKAMKECRIYPKEKKITFPYYPSALPATGSNMMLKGGQPYLEAFSNEERLLMHFDTGGNTNLSGKYFREHQEEVETEGVLRVIRNFTIQAGGSTKTLPQTNVYTETGEYDGLLGTDFIQLFDKVTINFDGMFVKFE